MPLVEPYSWLYSCLGCAALEWNDPIWAAPWQNQQCSCAPSKDSDQPGHPPSLIRVFAVHMKKAWVLSYPLSAQRRLWSDWVDAQADLSLRWAHTHFVGFVMSWLISICLLYPVFCCCFYWDFTARRNYLTSFEQVGRKWKILKKNNLPTRKQILACPSWAQTHSSEMTIDSEC